MRNKDNGNWGSVDGDVNADAIISDRKAGLKTTEWTCSIMGLLILGVALWYGFTQSHWAIVAALIFTPSFVMSGIAIEQYKAFTFSMITERRTQLLEADMNHLQDSMSDLDGKLHEILDRMRHPGKWAERDYHSEHGHP